MSEHFSEIYSRRLRRRTLLKLGASSGAAMMLVPTLASGSAQAAQPQFQSLKPRLTDDHAVVPGYSASVLIGWGDGLDGSPAPSFPLSAQEQRARFGFNNDFIAYTPIEGSRRGFLGVNHEYPMGHLMFPGYRTLEHAKRNVSLAQAQSEMAAVGHSVIEIVRTPQGNWTVVPESTFARRIDATTPMNVDGPARGNRLLRTAADPSGTRILGTTACCAGGKTPWGTVLIAEENVGDYFYNPGNRSSNDLSVDDPADIFRQWAAQDPRFDLSHEPNELNRFGWIIEYDPRLPAEMPVKHTALGRFEHEGAAVTCSAGEPLVVYMGDDDENEFIYRFVSADNYEPELGKANSALFARGTLYCARFDDDGGGRWLPMQYGKPPLTADAGFLDPGDVVIHARKAARLLGATPMDRPEGIAISPTTGAVYAALTKNKKKDGNNAANPRRVNAGGHIIELLPSSKGGSADHAADTFTWEILLQGGDPQAQGDSQGIYGKPPPQNSWLTNPDNLVCDPQGRLWIATDGMDDFGRADGLWCTAVSGSERATPRQLFQCPRGAELCGPEFTPDGESLFVAVQHPGKESGSTFTTPSTRWPDFDKDTPPRSAVLAITRSGSGPIGG